MRRTYFIIIAIVTGAVAGFVACTDTTAREETKVEGMTQAEMVKRGEYLVSFIGCDDCHSPKKMVPGGEPEIIPELRLSGYPSTRPFLKPDSSVINNGWMLFGPDLTSAAGPWGVSFAANLTSDPTGIGNWKEENFIRAIREGKFKGLKESRPLLPPMPWFVYKNMTDDDLKSIFAYLKTTPPVENVVPAPRQLSDFK